MQKNTRKVAPDGGWGWVACFGVSLVNVSMKFSSTKLQHPRATLQRICEIHFVHCFFQRSLQLDRLNHRLVYYLPIY